MLPEAACSAEGGASKGWVVERPTPNPDDHNEGKAIYVNESLLALPGCGSSLRIHVISRIMTPKWEQIVPTSA